MTIPKTIHYCWFGRNPLPESARRCIASWRRFFPDYEIKEWNEDNFDVYAIAYTRDAYKAGKYAFVSDYARFWVLWNEGGVYFDTDVEVVRPMDDILSAGAYMGWETPSLDGVYRINPGVGLAMPPAMPLCRTIMEAFEQRMTFLGSDGKMNAYTMIPMINDTLVPLGLKNDGKKQVVDGLTVYPPEYFCPLDTLTGKMRRTPQTRSIHWFTMSWMSPWQQFRLRLSRLYHRLKNM